LKIRFKIKSFNPVAWIGFPAEELRFFRRSKKTFMPGRLSSTRAEGAQENPRTREPKAGGSPSGRFALSGESPKQTNSKNKKAPKGAFLFW
jgi:hypothetical protein